MAIPIPLESYPLLWMIQLFLSEPLPNPCLCYILPGQHLCSPLATTVWEVANIPSKPCHFPSYCHKLSPLMNVVATRLLPEPCPPAHLNNMPIYQHVVPPRYHKEPGNHTIKTENTYNRELSVRTEICERREIWGERIVGKTMYCGRD